MLKEFEDIINEMDSELSEYSQKITYEQKLSNLKEKYKNETNLINEITYEIDSLNFFIEQGKLIPLFGYGNHCYPDINKFDNDYKNYLKQRFQDTSNSILKNMYLIIILNLKLKQEMNFFIDQSLNLLNYYLTTEINIELGNDLLMTTFDKCMSYRYKKDDIKLLIVKYVKAEFNTIFNRKHLIELMLLKKKVFKNDDFEGIEDICWECAQKSASMTKIEFLLLGQKISQKLQNNDDIWFDEIGKTYENLAEERQDSKMVQIMHLSDAIEYYKKGKHPQKVEETSIKLKNIQKQFVPTSIPFKFNIDSEINVILTEIYEKIPVDSNSFLEFLIHDKNEFLIPKLEKDDKNYNNFMDAAPLLSRINQLKLDNNHNIIQTLNIDNEEERIMDSNYGQYHSSLIFQKIFLNEIFVYASNLKIFTYDSVITYLSNCQKFLNISNNEKPLLYYFKPVIKEYFKQFESCLSNEEYNFVLFIDSLVSKLEFLVRKLCEVYNINMLKPQGNGTTSEKLLHDFFNDPNFKEVLLENDYDFLKFILLKPRLNLRNKSAHGFDLKIYTVNNANLLLLCFFRLLKYFIIIDDDYFQELEFFKHQNFDKISDIKRFEISDITSYKQEEM